MKEWHDEKQYLRNVLVVAHKRLKEDKITDRKSIKEILHKEMGIKGMEKWRRSGNQNRFW